MIRKATFGLLMWAALMAGLILGILAGLPYQGWC